MRWLTALAVGAALAAPPAPVHAEPHAVVFMYHRFGEGRYPSTNVDLDVFAAHLDYLAGAGYRVAPLAEVLGALEAGAELPDRTVTITVDDAFRSLYENGYPLLKARGLPFTVFVCTDPVDQGRRGYLTWDQMREMAAHGATFANHSASHDHLADRRPGEDEDAWRRRVTADILRAQDRLETELGGAPRWFAYPYGEYDRALADLVAGLGFTAFGQQSGPVGVRSDPRALPRFPMGGPYANPEQFRTKAATLPLPVVSAEPWDPVTRDRRPSLEVVLAPAPGARLDELAAFASGQGPVPVVWAEPGRRLRVRAPADLPEGRSRYNLTAPDRARQRYYWYSHPWLVRP